MKNNNKIFLGEFIASCFLVMVIVGSGIMAENLTNDNAVRLLANTIEADFSVLKNIPTEKIYEEKHKIYKQIVNQSL